MCPTYWCFKTTYICCQKLPTEIPQYWDKVANFGSQKSSSISPELARTTIENLEYLDASSFTSDNLLMKEMIYFKFGHDQQCIGIPLLPEEIVCLSCGSQLLLRKDRPSSITLYTQFFGTVPGTHYHK